MKTTAVWMGGCLAVLVAAGCGDGIDSSPVPYDRFCDRYATMACRIAVQCDCLGGIPASYCESYMRSDCADWVEAPVESGHMTYHEDEGGHCLATMEAIARDCSLSDAYWPESCDRMLTGLVPAGQACDGDEECQNGLECYNDQCVQMPTDGMACLDSSGCAEGAFCGEDDRCHTYRAAGQPCPEGDTACADGLYCDSRTTQCAPYISQGGECGHAPYDCTDDLYCSSAAGDTCQPYPGAGASCLDSDGDCRDGLYCDAGNTCTAQKPAGASCVEDEECRSWDCIDNLCEAGDDDSVCDYI